MRDFLARRPSPAMAVAFVALLAALSGTAVALPGTNTVDSGDIKNGQVKNKDIRNNAVTGGKVKDGAVKSADVGDDSLTGTDINESTLGQVPSANAANTANTASTANTANSATTATTADSANAIADNTVSSSKVQDGSLNGDDVGRASGTVTAYDPPSVASQVCAQDVVTLAAGVDMRNDAFALAMESTWPSGLAVTAENSTAIGAIRLNLCNNSAGAIDTSNQTFHWVAFDVVP
jgi:hypothetical protein